MASYSGRSAGSYGALGGEISFEWEPDPDVIESELMELAGYLENVEAPLLLSRRILKDDIRMRFEEKVDPDGNPWQEWSSSYADYRELHFPEGGILVRTEELLQAVSGESAYIVSPSGVFINTSGFPPYWLWNQQGSERGSATTQPSASEVAGLARFSGISHDEARRQIMLENEGGTGNNTLPARPFIGVSFEAELKILEVFDHWFDGSIQIATSPKGKVFARHAFRDASGRFASRE